MLMYLLCNFHASYDMILRLSVVPHLLCQLSIDPYLVELFVRICFQSWPSLEQRAHHNEEKHSHYKQGYLQTWVDHGPPRPRGMPVFRPTVLLAVC